MLRATIIAAMTLISSPAAADPRAQALADLLLAETGAPGVAVAWADASGSGVAAAGRRARGAEAAAMAGDLWHIGSNTKSMTATLVARLAAAGAIDRDDTVGAALGRAIPGLDPAWTEVTFTHLLTHRAGLPADLGLLPTLRLAFGGAPVPQARLAYARKALARRPAHAPGSTYLYSNAGYVIAGAMLEARTGQSWEDLIRAEVFAPLGLASAGFGAPGSAETLDQPRGHRALLGRLRPIRPGPNADNPPFLGPAGTMHISVADHLTFLRAHLSRDPAYLPPEAWDWLHTPPPGGDYSPGWVLREDGALYHLGSNTMWLNGAGFWPGRGAALVLATNSGDLRQERAFETVAERFLAGP